MLPGVDAGRVLFQGFRLAGPAQRSHLFDQLVRFLLRNEACRLQRVGQDPELRGAQLTLRDIVVFFFIHPVVHDLIAAVVQHPDILADHTGIAGAPSR